MIVLSTCFTNLFANSDMVNHNLSTGGVVNLDSLRCDSVYIAYSDLRIVNSKLIELEYEKLLNNKFRNIIHNDSLIIDDYKKVVNTNINKNKKVVRQRNIFLGSTSALFIMSLLLLFK